MEKEPMFAGNIFVIRMPVAVVGPELVTVSLKLTVPPWKPGVGMATWLIATSDSGLMVTTNCRVTVSSPPLAVPPLSRLVTVMIAVPLALLAGVKLRLPEELGLLYEIVGLGMRPGLLDEAVMVTV